MSDGPYRTPARLPATPWWRRVVNRLLESHAGIAEIRAVRRLLGGHWECSVRVVGYTATDGESGGSAATRLEPTPWQRVATCSAPDALARMFWVGRCEDHDG